jgi:two-component system, OmpR family, lantibiotic biosynthesis sensor histidine kinase NisK/SpaK
MGDWIPMEKIRNLSLKKTILLYFVISLTAAFLLSGFTVHFARNMQNKIWEKYIDYADYTDVFQPYGKKYEIEISRPNQSQMNRLDHHLSEMCDFMETYSVLIFSIVGSVVAVFFFYKNKLKTPLQELKDASQMIADNELDFHVSYENKDEMGTLCKEFEMMRSDLSDNNRKMWRMIDDEKALRNAIAHDIRSPLSILRGYQEMLLEFVSAESIKTEDVIDILQTGMYQIDRIEHFTENMRKMSHLEQRELQCSEIELSELAKKIEAEAAMLSKKESKLCKVERVQEQNIVKVDEELVMEVTDNLLENAVRYAQKSIALQIKKKDGFLIISVEDDGIGFVDTEEKVTEPFYHKNPQDDLKHFGLGMYISRIFCEKHGGNLKIYNARQGGAHVEALFKAE